MVSHLSVAVLLLAGVALVQSKRIVGGEETTIEQYPYIVQVEFFDRWFGWSQSCGANVLTSSWVLSAAHCFEGRDYTPRNRRIRAGTTYRMSGGSIHNVDFERNHPDYRRASRYDADINVVKLSTPLVYSNYIKQGTIVSMGFQLPDNTPVVHAGWGDTAWGGSASRILKHVQMYTINNDLCRTRYQQLPGNNIVTRNMICAGLLDVGGRDACQGDSGGPLYAGNIIVGVVSWGHRCANDTYPGISTSVASYTDWVIQNARG
ncbi:unnamed protein product [Leptosia nina]|uniref:Peptidase S1 domain-containing protein n=1 Tax=Leptosia nina TaxID=320188 RepID=A0AAV1JC22_9NEOP